MHAARGHRHTFIHEGQTGADVRNNAGHHHFVLQFNCDNVLRFTCDHDRSTIGLNDRPQRRTVH